MNTNPAALQAHAHELAAAFRVRLIEAAALRPEEALGIAHIRVALCSPIVDDTTYAVALHEIGHLAAPLGLVRTVATGDRGNLIRIEEDAAWTWARHYALAWTPAMDAVARWAEGTYAPPPAPIPTAPTTPRTPAINWKEWK